MADRYFSINSFEAVKQHLKQYWITNPVDGVDLKLDIVGEETLTAENDVTDHYVESNIAYQDQITIKPKIYTVQGEVGELVWYQKDTISQKVGQVAQRLEGVISFLPTRSRGFQQMKKKVMKAAQWIDTASNILDRFDTLTPDMTNQQQAYNWLLFWRNIRAPLLIKSPWGVLENYVVTSLRMTQPRETKDKSLISITFKEFRTTSVTTVEYDEEKYQGYGKQENEPKVDNGKTDGSDVSIAETDDKGNEFCYIEVNGEDDYFEAFYDKVKGRVQVFNDITGQEVLPDTELYHKAIDVARAQCTKQIEQEGWVLPK